MGSDKKVYVSSDGMFGTSYFMAVVGVAIYYIQQAQGFWDGVLGIIKALVWPATVMYKVAQLIQL
ncbi:MAG: hypothetical protein EHM43_04605 [Ignavibacteriae bacterium]|nr:MAG: hypothetical protein EHM43_04605 [Ignavibacteriota bacterium]